MPAHAVNRFPFLVNAVQNEQGEWASLLPVKTLMFWMWQRWEVEVCHQTKSNFGLGNKHVTIPMLPFYRFNGALGLFHYASLAGYRTWGLSNAPPVPTRWWRGSGRWSLNTLLRGFRACFMGRTPFPTPLEH
ncbi:MAG: hypothetical protein Q9P01_02125 [Anaerolineae bacterium]|nr:hypothetical protein [Anaerolineae bacterium]